MDASFKESWYYPLEFEDLLKLSAAEVMLCLQELEKSNAKNSEFLASEPT